MFSDSGVVAAAVTGVSVVGSMLDSSMVGIAWFSQLNIVETMQGISGLHVIYASAKETKDEMFPKSFSEIIFAVYSYRGFNPII